MAYEVALVVSVLGISFFLVYLASQLNGKDFWIQGLKTFLICLSLVFVMLNSGMSLKILEASNSTMTNGTYASLRGNLTTNLSFVMWTFILFMVVFLIYFLYSIYTSRKEEKLTE